MSTAAPPSLRAGPPSPTLRQAGTPPLTGILFVPQKQSSSVKKKFKSHHCKPKTFSSFKQSG